MAFMPSAAGQSACQRTKKTSDPLQFLGKSQKFTTARSFTSLGTDRPSWPLHKSGLLGERTRTWCAPETTPEEDLDHGSPESQWGTGQPDSWRSRCTAADTYTWPRSTSSTAGIRSVATAIVKGAPPRGCSNCQNN